MHEHKRLFVFVCLFLSRKIARFIRRNPNLTISDSPLKASRCPHPATSHSHSHLHSHAHSHSHSHSYTRTHTHSHTHSHSHTRTLSVSLTYPLPHLLPHTHTHFHSHSLTRIGLNGRVIAACGYTHTACLNPGHGGAASRWPPCLACDQSTCMCMSGRGEGING